eukprot:TRINITY_DN1806_c0_g1_i2.p1 TRINITY_DN1806_c0_g1~~TRINITY_DN1806_c0_g1_i2.p1  ORF type:complete len:184 (+),score=26.99 TRINITY_DN1806_c0_g1_i2:48-554(+)
MSAVLTIALVAMLTSKGSVCSVATVKGAAVAPAVCASGEVENGGECTFVPVPGYVCAGGGKPVPCSEGGTITDRCQRKKRHRGCYNIDHNTSFSHLAYYGAQNTVQRCSALCSEAGYAFGALEKRSECWCGNSIHTAQRTVGSACNMKCSGDRRQPCGGLHRATIIAV